MYEPEIPYQPNETDKLDITAGATSPALISRPTAAERSFKASYGLGVPYVDVFNQILSGQERPFREKAAAAKDVENSQAQMSHLKAILGSSMMDLPSGDFKKAEYIANVASATPKVDPRSVIEEYYAKQMFEGINTAQMNLPGTFLESVVEIPMTFEAIKNKATALQRVREYLHYKGRELDDAVEGQSWGSWGVDFLKTAVPFYTEAVTRGWTETNRLFGLRGNNYEQQRNDLLSLPWDAQKDLIDKMADYYKQHNPQVGRDFFHDLYGQTSDKVYLNNFFTGVDMASLGLGSLATKAGRALGRKLGLIENVQQAAKDIIQETSTGPASKVTLAEGAGDVGEAAVQKQTAEVTTTVKGSPDPIKRNLEALLQIFRIGAENARKNAGPMHTDLANRIAENYEQFGNDLAATISAVAKVEQIPEALVSEQIMRGIKDAVKAKYSGLRNTIMNISDIYVDPLTNTKWVDTYLGRPSGTLFASLQEARNFMKFHEIEGTVGKKGNNYYPGESVQQKGIGWYIKVSRPVDQEWDAIRNGMISTKTSQDPSSLTNWWSKMLGGGKFLTPENALSLDHRINRKIATYAPARLMEMYAENAQAIKDLKSWALPFTSKRQKWEEWKRVVDSTRDIIDKDAIVVDPANKIKGYDFKGPGEFEEYFNGLIGHLPDEQQIAAYFAWKANKDMDLVFRRLHLYKNQTNKGFENISFSMLGDKNTRLNSPTFSGRILRELPGGQDPILILGNKVGNEVITDTEKLGSARWGKYAKDVKEGKRYVIEVYDVPSRPLEGLTPKIGDNRVRYILTDNLKTSPLKLEEMLGRRGGPHQEYDYSHYVKQARVIPQRSGKSVIHGYEGDNTLFPVSIRAMGEDIAGRLNQLLPLLDKGKWKQAETLYNTLGIHIPWDEFQGWFKPGHGPGGQLIPPRLNTKEPFQVVEHGKMIADVDNSLIGRYTRPDGKSTFKDYTHSGSQSKLGKIDFTTERDAYDIYTLRNEGTIQDPLYKSAPARFVDPITSMNRALSRIVHSSFLDDYKQFALEHWIQKAKNWLDVDQLSQIRSSPLTYFHNPKWKSGMPQEIKNKLEAEKMQIDQLLGRKTSIDLPLQGIAQKLHDSIYNKWGPNAIFDLERREKLPIGLRNVSVLLDPLTVLPKLSDPVRFMRNIVFHPSMGMFNPVQYFTQLNTFAAINAIAGADAGWNGTYASLLHTYSRMNKRPDILEHLDTLASTSKIPGVNWKKGQWKEANELLDRTGFDHVGGEYANLDYHMAPKTIQSGAATFFNWGTMFFAEGERQVRAGAWYTAYREFRKANPNKRITDTDLGNILERADLLNINMSRASSSALHSGLLSIPMQFVTYQIRMAELFFSKRLTDRERGRLLLVNSALYGVPTAYGVTALPIGDYIRQSALEKGYVVGDNFIETLVNEGFPAMAIALATGLPNAARNQLKSGDNNILNFYKEAMQSGNFYNFGDRWGMQGMENIREALRGDKPLWTIIGGAFASKLKGTFELSDGFTRAMMAKLSGEGDKFPAQLDDFVDIFKEVGIVNNTYRTIVALNTAKWVSKKGLTLDSDVSKGSAIFSFITGLQSQHITDLNLLAQSIKDTKEKEKFVQDKFLKEFRKGVEAADAGNENQAGRFISRAMVYLDAFGIPEDRKTDFIRMAEDQNKTLIDRIDWQWATKSAPSGDEEKRMEALRRKLRIRNKNEGGE